MTLADTLGLSDGEEAVLNRILQAGLLGIALYGVGIGRVDVAVNAAGSLGVTLLPALLQRETRVRMNVGLVLWLTAAATFHALGILGPYRNFWWYDHVSHALTASIIAGVAYATVDALDRSHEDLYLPDPYRSVVLFLFVLATAVTWEVLEFGVTRLSVTLGADSSMLVIFGPVDIITDIAYSAAGGLAVVLWGRAYFRGLSRKFSRHVFR